MGLQLGGAWVMILEEELHVPETVYCSICDVERPLLGIRCTVCGLQLVEFSKLQVSPLRSALRAIDERPWLLLVPLWVLSGLTLLLTTAVWKSRVVVVVSRGGASHRDVVPGENLLFVLLIGSALYCLVFFLRGKIGGWEGPSRFWSAAGLILAFLLAAIAKTAGGGSLAILGTYV
jgi:hypothetical protein